MTADKLVQLDPKEIQAEDNIRFSVLPTHIDELADSIAALGGVQQPVEVEPLVPPANGYKYRLTTGFGRYMAVLKLNKVPDTNLKLPAIVRPIGDPLTRLKHQLAENVERKSLSPMDMAVACRKLLDAGQSRLQVREVFKRPAKKGMAPASNSWLNQIMSLLELPKPVQAKIHSGVVGTKAAFTLAKLPPERQQEVLDKAEADRLAEIAKDEAEEQKYIAREAKAKEAIEAAEKAVTEADHTKAELELAQAAYEEKLALARAAFEASKARGLKGEDKKKAIEHYKAADTDSKAAERALNSALSAVTKAQETATKKMESAEELKARLAEARTAGAGRKGKGRGAAVNEEDVERAAVSTGASTKPVKLTASDVRNAIEQLAAGKGYSRAYGRVTQIGAVLLGMINGELSYPKAVAEELAVITGEKVTKAKAS